MMMMRIIIIIIIIIITKNGYAQKIRESQSLNAHAYTTLPTS